MSYLQLCSLPPVEISAIFVHKGVMTLLLSGAASTVNMALNCSCLSRCWRDTCLLPLNNVNLLVSASAGLLPINYFGSETRPHIGTLTLRKSPIVEFLS